MAERPSTTDGFKAFWWVMGVISLLLSAGVVGAIATYAQVGRLDTNVTLLRTEVQREMDRQEYRIQTLEAKVDAYLATQAQNQPGGR